MFFGTISAVSLLRWAGNLCLRYVRPLHSRLSVIDMAGPIFTAMSVRPETYTVLLVDSDHDCEIITVC